MCDTPVLPLFYKIKDTQGNYCTCLWGDTSSFFHDVIAALLGLHVELRTIKSKMRKISIVILNYSFRCPQGAVKTRRRRLYYPATEKCSVCQIMSLRSTCSLLNTTFLTTPIYQVLHKWFLFYVYFRHVWAKFEYLCLWMKTFFPSSSTHLQPVRPGEWPPVHSGSAQRAVDQSVLQGSAAGAGPGQSVLSLTGQQQNRWAYRRPHGCSSA